MTNVNYYDYVNSYTCYEIYIKEFSATNGEMTPGFFLGPSDLATIVDLYNNELVYFPNLAYGLRTLTLAKSSSVGTVELTPTARLHREDVEVFLGKYANVCKNIKDYLQVSADVI